MADTLLIRGAREHNLRNVSLELPRDKLIVFTGLSGFGQVVAGVRHDLRRGPAPLRRVAVVVRPPVPRPDGQARRRLHRGPVAGHLHRPEVGLAQPAVDGRHHHRGLRLPAAAVRPHRRAALPRTTARSSPARRPQQIVDRVLELPEGTRFQVLAPVVRGRKGTYDTLLGRPRHAGLRPGPRRRRARTSSPTRSTSPATRSTPSRSSSTAWCKRERHRAPAHRLARDGAARWPTAWPRCSSCRARATDAARPRRSRSASTWPARRAAGPTTSWRPATSRSTRPTARASTATASAPASRSTPSWSCPNPDLSLAEGAIAPWAGGRTQYFAAAARGGRARSTASPSTCRGRS